MQILQGFDDPGAAALRHDCLAAVRVANAEHLLSTALPPAASPDAAYQQAVSVLCAGLARQFVPTLCCRPSLASVHISLTTRETVLDAGTTAHGHHEGSTQHARRLSWKLLQAPGRQPCPVLDCDRCAQSDPEQDSICSASWSAGRRACVGPSAHGAGTVGGLDRGLHAPLPAVPAVCCCWVHAVRLQSDRQLSLAWIVGGF